MWTTNEKQILPVAFLIMLALTILLYFLLRNKSEKIKLIPFQVIAGCLIVLEIIKQYIALTADGGYDFWRLPVHFCSLILYCIIIVAFSKGKLQRYAKNLSIVATMFLFIIFSACPNIVIGGACNDVFATFYTFQSLSFHLLGVWWLMLSIALDDYIPVNKDLILLVITYAFYFGIMILFTYLTNTNYGGVILTSDIPLLETMRDAIGQVWYVIVLTIASLGVSVMLFYIYYFFVRLRNLIKSLFIKKA